MTPPTGTAAQPSHSFSLTALDGASIRVRGDGAVVEQLSLLWGPLLGAQDPSTTPGAPSAPPGDALQIDAEDLAAASASINRTLVDGCPHPAVHAGVVRVGGGVIAFPAASGHGKSTLTAALCLSGAGYLSDEALVLREGGELPFVLPYPKPVALSPWSAASVGLPAHDGLPGEQVPGGGRELLFEAARLGGTAAGGALGHLLLPVRDPAGPRLEELPRPAGLAAMLAMGFNHYRDPRRFLELTAAAVNGARVHRLHVGEPLATAELVLDMLA